MSSREKRRILDRIYPWPNRKCFTGFIPDRVESTWLGLFLGLVTLIIIINQYWLHRWLSETSFTELRSDNIMSIKFSPTTGEIQVKYRHCTTTWTLWALSIKWESRQSDRYLIWIPFYLAWMPWFSEAHCQPVLQTSGTGVWRKFPISFSILTNFQAFEWHWPPSVRLRNRMEMEPKPQQRSFVKHPVYVRDNATGRFKKVEHVHIWFQ